MAILDLQRRQRELGRIRMGDKTSSGAPHKLSEFRLTSSARHLLEHAAALWGGEVREWKGSPSEGQWELYTKTAVLPIVIPPSAEPVSQWYEQWTGGGCTHRCDGARNHINDSPCSCTDETRGTPKGCKATTRVNVMLPDLPDVGVWRLETHGLNAAYELPGTIDVIQMASATGRFLTGRLRIEHRTSKKEGLTRKFIVPVIDLDVTMGALMSGEASGTAASLGTGGDGQRALPTGSAPLPPGDDSPAAPDYEPSAPPDDSLISDAQRRRMFAVARDHDIETPALKALIMQITGQDSSKAVLRTQYDEVIAAIEAAGATTDALFETRAEDPA